MKNGKVGITCSSFNTGITKKISWLVLLDETCLVTSVQARDFKEYFVYRALFN